jgi:hypothetical protein
MVPDAPDPEFELRIAAPRLLEILRRLRDGRM